MKHIDEDYGTETYENFCSVVTFMTLFQTIKHRPVAGLRFAARQSGDTVNRLIH